VPFRRDFPNVSRWWTCSSKNGWNIRFTSRAYQKLVGIDIYTASRDIKDLIRKGVVRLLKPKGRVYEVLTEVSYVEKPPELIRLEPILKEKGFITNGDVRRVFGLSRLQAYRLLKRLVEYGFLKLIGKGRSSRYGPAYEMHQPN